MRAVDRLPDWRSLAFWEWAVTHKAANPTILARWFPESSLPSWQHRCKTAVRDHGVVLLKAKRDTFANYPADPPDGWPERTPQTGSIDPDRAVPPKEQQLPAAEVERFADGSCKSTRVVPLSTDDLACPESVLVAHGFDPEKWVLVSMKNKEYQGFHKIVDGFVPHPSGDRSKDVAQSGHRVVTMYASQITVKPKEPSWSIADLARVVSGIQTPITVKQPGKKGKRLFEVPPVDTHFGNSTLEWYRETQARIVEHIGARIWDRIVLRISDDFFHTDNFKNTTSNGTPQSSMWWPDAWRDGLAFCDAIILAALEHCDNVFFVYVPGNHDESMTWAFTQMLKARYPQVTFDDEIAERKVHVFGDCAIGMTHGDEKVRKDLDRVFMSEFPEFAAATFREVHMGHLHHEKSVDNFGVKSRSLPTAARTDRWHRETGYVGAVKGFQLFEWEQGRGVTDIHYV